MNRSFSYIEVILIFAATLLPLMSAIAGGFPLAAAIIPGLLTLGIITKRKQVSWNDLYKAVKKGLYRNRNVAWLLVFIGILLPTWGMAGTIEDLNTLFLTFLSREHFLTLAFLITGLMSFTVGSAVGSLSIVGIPLMSAGLTLGMPEVLIAGALVSGAFVGDRSSPLSSSFQLLAFSTELSIREHLRTITPTMLITVTATAGIFFFIDLVTTDGNGAMTAVEAVSWSSASISLVPPLLLLIMIFLGKEMKTSFLSAIAAAGVILLLRGSGPVEWVQGAFWGFESLNGLIDMLPFVIFILIVGAYCQIIEETGMLQPFLERVFTDTTSLTKNTAQTIGVAGGVSLLSPNQSFPILLTGRALLPHWEKHFHKRLLARTLADSTVVFAGMVPWSLLAILCSTILGVPVLYYLPAAVFLWLSPVVTLLYSWLITKKLDRKGKLD
jgi:Na+:H+ antiporter, NhaC family